MDTIDSSKQSISKAPLGSWREADVGNQHTMDDAGICSGPCLAFRDKWRMEDGANALQMKRRMRLETGYQ